jgi:hypothetical protein
MKRVYVAVSTACLLIAVGGAFARRVTDDRQVKQELEEALRTDTAVSFTDAVDSAGVFMSPLQYRAIQAVERYRSTFQSPGLTASERDLMNFDIWVLSPEEASSETWIGRKQASTSYLITLAPRYRRGEPVRTDRRAQAGRIAKYAIRKSDFVVVSSAIRN